MRHLTLLFAGFLAGCAPMQSADKSLDPLARELDGRTAGKAQACISPFGNQSLRVVDPQTLAYGSGAIVHVNRLRSPCPSLRPTAAIIVESQSGQYCRGDSIRALEPGSTIPSPVCSLGDWTPHSRR
jgi:hypothetical protein